jgi:HlyD family secretion protein
MKPRALLVPTLTLLALVGGVGAWGWLRGQASPTAWRTSPLTRQDVQRLVNATGTLEADPTIEVGTQVSGRVAELLVDYNSRVEAGDLLARIDPTLLEADVASAEARLSEATAQRDRHAVELRRVRSLHEKAAATDQELEVAVADAAVAEAQVRSAEVTVSRARRNLGYAEVRAPVAGTIVRRAVTLGQTVNAGFSAPVLFTLAADLEKMMLLVRVDESDVGQVQEGQTVNFTVQAWPDRTFSGTVRQVRIDATVEQGVVTYTAVVDVPNPDRALMPSMTATADFVIAEVADVLCAPNAALRFSPEAGVPEVGARPGAAAEAGKGGDRSGGMGGSGKGGRRRAAPTEGVLWTVSGPTLVPHPVKLGLRGAECTEVTGDGLSADLPVVLGVDHAAVEAAPTPFGAPGGSRGRP